MSEVFEKPPNSEPAEPPAKQKRKRKPLSPSKKKALVERLAKARAAKKNGQTKQNKKEEPVAQSEAPAPAPAPVVEPAPAPAPAPVEKKEKKTRKPRQPTANSKYREQQLELQNLRHELELQKLKNELEEVRKPKKRNNEVMETIEEETPKQSPQDAVVVEDKPQPKAPTIVKKPRGSNLAPKNLWSF